MSWFSQMDVFSDGYAGIGVWRAGFGPFVEKIAANDIRKKWFMSVYTKYQSVKFIGNGQRTASIEALFAGTTVPSGWELGQYIYLRSEEAWFMKAEALAHKNSLADAKAVLKDVMKYRVSDYECTATTKADIISEIIFQKRVEYWGEGMEYIDNRRLNIPVDRTLTTWPTNNNHHSSGQIKVQQEDLLMLYQIPLREIDNNPAIGSANQNP